MNRNDTYDDSFVVLEGLTSNSRTILQEFYYM